MLLSSVVQVSAFQLELPYPALQKIQRDLISSHFSWVALAEVVAAAERIALRKQVFLKMFLFQFSGRKKRFFSQQETLFSQAPFVAHKAYYRRINMRPAAERISVAYEGSFDRDAGPERFHKDFYMIIRSISKAMFTFVPDAVPASSYRSVTRI